MLKKIFKRRLFMRKKGKEVVETTTQEKELEVLQELHKNLAEDFPSLRNLQDQKQLEDLRNAPKTAISFFTSYDDEEYSNANRSIEDDNSALGIKESDADVNSGFMSPTDDFYSEMSTFSDDYCGLDKVLRSTMADKMVRRLEEGPIVPKCSTPQFRQKRYERNVDLPRDLINLNVTPELRRFYDNMMRKAEAQQHLGRKHNNGKDKESNLVSQTTENNAVSTTELTADERDTSDPRTNGNEEPRQTCFDATSCENKKDSEAAATRKPLRQSKIFSKYTQTQSHKQPQQEKVLVESSNNIANARLPQMQIHPKPDLSLSQQMVNNVNDLSKAPAEMDDYESRQKVLLDAAEKSKFLTIRGWRSSPIPTGDDSTFGIGAESVMDVEHKKTPQNDEEIYPSLASPIYSDMSLRAVSGDQSGPLKFLSSLKISSKQPSESTERHSNTSILQRTSSMRGNPMTRTTSLGLGETIKTEFGNKFVEEGRGPLCLTNGLYEDAIAKLQALLLPQCCSVLLEPRSHAEQSFQSFPHNIGQRWQPTDSSNSTTIYNMSKPELKVHSLGPNPSNPPIQIKPISTESIKTNPKHTEVKRMQPKLLRPKKEVLKRAQSPPRTRGGQEPEKSTFYQTNRNNVEVLDNDTFESLKLIPTGIATTAAEAKKPTQTQDPNGSRIDVPDHHVIEIDHEEMNLSQNTRSSSKTSSTFALNSISDVVLASKMQAEFKETSETNKVPCDIDVSNTDVKLFSSSIDVDQKGAVNIAIMPASDIVTDKTSVTWKSCSSIKSEKSRTVKEARSTLTHSSVNQISTELDDRKLVFNTNSPEREYLPNLLARNTQLDEQRMNAYDDRDSIDSSRHSHRLMPQEISCNPTYREQEDPSSKIRLVAAVLTDDPSGASEKESARSMSNSRKEKVNGKSQTHNSNPPFVEKWHLFGGQASAASMKSYQCDKSAKSSIKLRHSRPEASMSDLERVHSSREDESKKSQFACNDERRLSSGMVESNRGESKHSNLGFGESFTMQSVIPRQLILVSNAEKKTSSSYERSNTSDNQRPCGSSTDSSRNAMTSESQGGFTSQSCPGAIYQSKNEKETLDVPEFRDDQLLHSPLVRSGQPKPLSFFEVSKDTTKMASSKKYSFNSHREVFETVKEWKNLSGNTGFSPISGVSLKQRSTLSKALTNTGDDHSSCASKNRPHEHRSLPSSYESVDKFSPTTKDENYPEGTMSDKNTRRDASVKSDSISRSSSRQTEQTSQSEGLAQSYRQRSKSVSSSRSNKNKDDRRCLSSLKGAREEPLTKDTRNTDKSTDPYMSATFFMNADDYDGSTLTSRGQDSRISKSSGDDRDVSTLTMNDSSVVDPWQEITGASRVIVKAINRIEAVRSEDTDYESTADQVEFALQTLHNYAYSLGIKERELLLLAVNNDGRDDSNSKDAREAFAADLLNFLRRSMDPAELEVRLMQSYDSSAS